MGKVLPGARPVWDLLRCGLTSSNRSKGRSRRRRGWVDK
jgi:hypothetical protein